MTTLNFLEECHKLGKKGSVALIEAGKDGERCGASRWTMAYLRLDKDNCFDDKWKDEMRLVSNGLADLEYCKKMEQEVPITAEYLLDHGVELNHYDEENVLLEFNTNQHFVSPEGGGHAIINALFSHIKAFDSVDIIWETTAEKLLTTDEGEVCGVKVRKPDGRLASVRGKKVMLACGGFEGNKELSVSVHYLVNQRNNRRRCCDSHRILTADQARPLCRPQNRTPRAYRAGIKVQYWPRPPDGT